MKRIGVTIGVVALALGVLLPGGIARADDAPTRLNSIVFLPTFSSQATIASPCEPFSVARCCRFFQKQNAAIGLIQEIKE